MVDVTAGVVADGGADVGGKGVEILEEFLGGLFLEVGMGTEGLVEIVDVGGVVLAVMEGHGFAIDVGFEGVGGVGERRKSERSGGCRCSLSVGGGRQELRTESGGQEEFEEEE